MAYEYTPEALEKIDQSIAEQNEQNVNFELYERDYEGAKDSRWSNLVENSRSLFKGNFVESVKNLATEWTSDTKTIQQRKVSLDSTRQNVDKATSDRLLEMVVRAFKKNIEDANDRLSENTKVFWQKKAQEYRGEMVRLITGSDDLSEKQRTE